MAKTSPQLEWCIVRLGDDFNWWVDEISDEVHWDVDGLSIIDPRQMTHIIELLEPLQDYGFDADLLETAFFFFRIDSDLGKGRVRLARTNESLLDSDDKLFALPNILDEETGPYADFIDSITKLRVKMLNDSLNFEKKLTVDELEEEIRDEENNSFLEGRSVHLFQEIISILEYVPAGYESDDDAEEEAEEEVPDVFPDIEEEEEEGVLKEDETMRWDEDEEEEDDFYSEDEESDEEDEDEDEDEEDDLEEEEEEDEDEAPKRGRSRK
jgi:hypothetical protein